jgi:hypothetical protein
LALANDLLNCQKPFQESKDGTASPTTIQKVTSMISNILLLCHGMTIQPESSQHLRYYDLLTEGLWKRAPDLEERFRCIVPISYGHEIMRENEQTLRSDEQLTRAQRFIQKRIAYDEIVKHPSDEDELLPRHLEPATQLLRRFTEPVRDTVFALGMTDVLYYASSDGEREVRNAVYGQILDALDSCPPDSEIRLHIIAHSLGATVMFDFLYALFRKDLGHSPSANREILTDVPDPKARFLAWRQGTTSQGRPKLGSFVTLGGQIPFFFMRKQSLVEQLAREELLDPENIGVPKSGGTVWKNFYDVDDVFGYPVRGLFEAYGTIRQYQVNTGRLPYKAHTDYWRHPKVLTEITELLERTTKDKRSY